MNTASRRALTTRRTSSRRGPIRDRDKPNTMEIKINYLKPALGKYLLASASIKRQGRTTSFVTIELHDEDKLVAYATGTYAIISDD